MWLIIELTLNWYVCKTAMFVQIENAMCVTCVQLITNAMFETKENDWHWTAMFVKMLLTV